MKGLARKHIYITHRHRQQCGDSRREERVGAWVEVGKVVGGMGTERGFAWGNGCRRQCADDVLLSCTFETCMVLQTDVTQ